MWSCSSSRPETWTLGISQAGCPRGVSLPYMTRCSPRRSTASLILVCMVIPAVSTAMFGWSSATSRAPFM